MYYYILFLFFFVCVIVMSWIWNLLRLLFVNVDFPKTLSFESFSSFSAISHLCVLVSVFTHDVIFVSSYKCAEFSSHLGLFLSFFLSFWLLTHSASHLHGGRRLLSPYKQDSLVSLSQPHSSHRRQTPFALFTRGLSHFTDSTLTHTDFHFHPRYPTSSHTPHQDTHQHSPTSQQFTRLIPRRSRRLTLVGEIQNWLISRFDIDTKKVIICQLDWPLHSHHRFNFFSKGRKRGAKERKCHAGNKRVRNILLLSVSSL